MLPNSQPRWRAVPAEALLWREWDGEIVVFNQKSGSTHLLGQLAGEVLRRLTAADQGLTIPELAADLTDDPVGQDAEAWTRAVAGVLSDFARLRLAHPDKS